MFETTIITLFVALTISFIIAAWPFLLAPAFRVLRTCLTGSCCIGLGTGTIALLAAILPTATMTTRALADDKDPKTLIAEADPLIGDTAIEIPAGRPDWIAQQPSYSGKLHTIPIASGPYATSREALRALDDALVKATQDYVAEQLNSDLAARLITFDARTIRQRFVKDNIYRDEAQYSVGKMHENFALLQFDQKFRSELTRRWNQVRAGSRLSQTGVIAAAILLLLASVFGYLRADQATQAHYTRRLQIMAAAAILAVVSTGVLALRFIPRL